MCSDTNISEIPDTYVNLVKLECYQTNIRFLPNTLAKLRNLYIDSLLTIPETLLGIELLEMARCLDLYDLETKDPILSKSQIRKMYEYQNPPPTLNIKKGTKNPNKFQMAKNIYKKTKTNYEIKYLRYLSKFKKNIGYYNTIVKCQKRYKFRKNKHLMDTYDDVINIIRDYYI